MLYLKTTAMNINNVYHLHFFQEVVDVKSSDEFWWIQIDLGAFENRLLNQEKF